MLNTEFLIIFQEHRKHTLLNNSWASITFVTPVPPAPEFEE